MMEFHGDNPVQQNMPAQSIGGHEALFHDYLKLARAGEVGPDGKPIFVTPSEKPMPEAVLAKELGGQLKDNDDPSRVLPLTKALLAPMKNADDIENSLDWLQDKTDKQLKNSPWSVDFKYHRENDRLDVTVTNRDNPSRGGTVSEPIH